MAGHSDGAAADVRKQTNVALYSIHSFGVRTCPGTCLLFLSPEFMVSEADAATLGE